MIRSFTSPLLPDDYLELVKPAVVRRASCAVASNGSSVRRLKR